MAPPLCVAHRLPNTAADCDSLAAAGAAGFELDIQLRASTVVVSHYLPFLQIPGWLEHDGRRFRWGGGSALRDPQLLDAIQRIPEDALIVLDPKEVRARRRQRLAAAVSAALAAIPIDRRRFVVTTGDLADLRTYRAAGLATWRTVGTARELASLLRGPPLADAGVAVRHTLLTPDVVLRLRAQAATVATWTVNDVERAREMAALGVDVITTDRIEVMSALRR